MWKKTENSIYQKFNFKNFDEAFEFIQKVADLAKQNNHHPKITNIYNVVELELSTHSSGNMVTEKDEQFVKQIDEYLNREIENLDNKLTKAKLYTDGGSRGNPGPSALGYVVMDADENIIKKDSKYLGITTNNQAEYQALVEGINAAKSLGVEQLDIFMDSELIVKQMTGLYRVKNKDLLPLHLVVKELINGFKNVSFNHVLREKNEIADSMVNECLDTVEKSGV